MDGESNRPSIWLRLSYKWWVWGAFYFVFYVFFLPRAVLEGDSHSRWERLADNEWFIAASYIVAFLPWTVYSVVDHVDGQWRRIEDLYLKSRVAKLFCIISVFQLLTYSCVQFIAEDWKEAMAALVVLVAAWLPLLRLYRQNWLLRASRNLGNVLHSLPSFGGYSFWDGFRMGKYDDHNKDSWSPGNSNKFFDNDHPGEGVSNVSYVACHVQWAALGSVRRLFRQKIHVRQPLHTDFFIGDSPPIASLYEGRHYHMALHLMRYWLNIVVAGDEPKVTDRWVVGTKKSSILGISSQRQSGLLKAQLESISAPDLSFQAWWQRGTLRAKLVYDELLCLVIDFARTKPAKAAENGLTRSLWLYENLTGHGWLNERRGKLAQVLHLGLVVHVGMAVAQGFTPERLDWINFLAGSNQQDTAGLEKVRHPSYGHLKTPGLLLHDWFPKGALKWFQKDDFDEVFAKLPTERSSLKENCHLRWEDIMFIASSTIELHAFVEVMFGYLLLVDNVGKTTTVSDTIWKYISGAFLLNHAIHGNSSATIGRQEQLHDVIKSLGDEYRAALTDAFIKGSNVEANWNDIIVHCGNIVDIVTNAMQREAPQQREQPLMPENLKDKDWHIQLTETRTALIGKLNALLPMYKQPNGGESENADASTTVSGPTPEAASASVPGPAIGSDARPQESSNS